MVILLGIDVGTSACKTAAFDAENGRVIASSTQDYPVYHPKPGYVEQDANDWWEAVCKGIKDLCNKGVDASQIAAVGIDGQSWSCIPIDKDGEVLARTPIWMDTRADELAREVESQIGAERIFKVSGNPFKPSYVTPKFLHMQKYQPELIAKTDKIIGSNSFIAFRLTGAVTHDYSQGYAWHFFNEAKLEYDKELAADLGVDMRYLPDLVSSDTIIGKVTAEAAALTGLLAGTPVVAGGLDAACGTLGAGVCKPGQTQEQGGQAGGMSICVDSALAHPQLILSPHLVPGQWLLQGGTVGGGGTLAWFSRELGAAEEQIGRENGLPAFAVMDDEASASPLGSKGMIYLPYMSGERSPLWDAKAQGVFFGLGYDKTRGDMIRAILEGTAFALEHNVRVARTVGAEVSEFRAMGGAANSRIWTQIKADITGKPFVVPAADTATTWGAAIVAGVGAGVYASYDEAVDKTISIQRSHQPDMDKHQAYEPYYEIYESLYPTLKDTMHKLADLKNSGADN